MQLRVAVAVGVEAEVAAVEASLHICMLKQQSITGNQKTPFTRPYEAATTTAAAEGRERKVERWGEGRGQQLEQAAAEQG